MSKDNPQSDANLIAALKAGNKEALGHFYREGRDAFMQWATKNFSVPTDDIIDVYQDAITIMYENIVNGRYTKGESTIKTYFYAIAKNLLYQRIQRKERESAKLDVIYDYYASEEFSVENEEMILATQSAFALMLDPCKSILKFFYYDKLSMMEIADRLGYKSDKVVKSQKVRCLKTLRERVIDKLGVR